MLGKKGECLFARITRNSGAVLQPQAQALFPLLRTIILIHRYEGFSRLHRRPNWARSPRNISSAIASRILRRKHCPHNYCITKPFLVNHSHPCPVLRSTTTTTTQLCRRKVDLTSPPSLWRTSVQHQSSTNSSMTNHILLVFLLLLPNTPALRAALVSCLLY
jgi:hypothetical protein